MVKPIELDSKNSDPTILRSLMYFSKTQQVFFGQEAIQNYTAESAEGRFIRSIKKYLPSASFTGTRIGENHYNLEDLIGRFLIEMKRRADLHFDEDVNQVVLGRPAKFSMSDDEDKLAQDRLKEAAIRAGFKHIEFFPEPLAAAYNYKTKIRDEKLVLVVDLGGGTSDFTVIKIHPGSHRDEDVLSLGGVSVAGDALDGCIMMNKIAAHLGSEVTYQFPMSSNLLRMPISLKHHLSSPPDITLMSRSDIMGFLNEVRKCTIVEEDNDRLDQLFSLIGDNLGFSIFEEIESLKRQVCSSESKAKFSFHESEVSIDEEMTYDEFVTYTEEKITKIFETMDEVVRQAQISHHQVDSICCTGGTSKVPLVAQGLASRFGAEKIESFESFHSVIQGLAERAKELNK